MAEASTPERVLVTGATGFLAAHIIKLLQEKGYQVRGSVRGLENEDKVKYLKELVPEAAHPLELVEADCTKEDGWKSAIEGCTYVVHTASPLPLRSPADENEVITPAVEGVKNVLKAAKEAKCVKRVVLTSAGLAIMGYMHGGEFSEEDWPENEDELDTYAKSKTKAEKAAWEFVKNLEDGEKFELAVINPTAILGPVLHKQAGTSMEIIKRILTKNPPLLPKLNIPVVDVRDVAQAHYMAMTVPEAAGNRHIVSTENIWWSEMAAHVAEEFKPQGYKIATMGCPKIGIQLAAIFDKDVKAILPNWNTISKVDNTRMKEVLKIEEPIPAKTTVVDMAYSMIEGGFVKKTPKYRGRNWREVFEQEKAEREAAKEEKIAAKRASKVKKAAAVSKATAEVKNGDAEAVKENGEEEKKDEGTEKGEATTAAEAPTEEKKEEEPKSEEKAEGKKEDTKEEDAAAKEEETKESAETKEAETKEEEKADEKQEEEVTKEETKDEAKAEEAATATEENTEENQEEQKEAETTEEAAKEEETKEEGETTKEEEETKEETKEEETKEEEKEVEEQPKEEETAAEEEEKPAEAAETETAAGEGEDKQES